MLSLVVATLFFLLIHLVVSGTTLRDALVGRIGEQPYLGLFSLASLVGIVWMSWAYGHAPYVELWPELPGVREASLVVVLVAVIFMFVGLTVPTPTAVGQQSLLEKEDAARGILRITRHPFLIGAGLWAIMHLLANGDEASLVFFGGLLVVALAGPPSIDRKRARSNPETWPRYRDATSITPFVAILQGRNRLVIGELVDWRLLVAVAVYFAFLSFHGRLFGVAVLGS